ncbi:hypothetical protein EOB36_00725 [Mesorhizobium sp. M6A.T.Cr.TU.017.01.1.1]|uniref:DUF6119 family protein n=1 Tax=Mesorhizobium sp. M6A.T.Cr.TU.017.01.1.1 TaxID=2496774 RepID=UPI000FD4788D|nr:DUF6119 family protein [Mesorhizobium sp. M6A.T.Cr.TU.017.01.1.1]RUV05201.1 hypothetical protein EOB36_00725 [Mesorhizobium sp. M6A.T.Cr.TU.017.01.1.1]
MAKRSFSFRLLKIQIVDPADSLKENHRLEEKPLVENPESKRLFAGQAYSSAPAWISFFNPEDRPQFEGLYGGQAAAILFVQVTLPPAENEEGGEPESRWLAVCFGMGFQDLRPEALESQFGLKVALNRLGRERIKSIDTRKPEDATIQTRSQNSRTGEIFDFGLDTNHIILQAITGKSSEIDFGGTLTGADGLKLSCETDYNQIGAKALQIVTSFGDTAYQELFPWYGKITPVRDRIRIESLDHILVEKLRSGQLDGIHLAPPEIVEYQDIDRFRFSGMPRGHDGFDELRLDEYLDLFDENSPLTLANLKADKVRTAADGGPFFDRWPVFKCISAEINFENMLYILAAEEWYAVRADFVADINTSIAEIPAANLGLPPYQPGEKEGAYNTRAVVDRDDLHLYDKELISFEGERGRVEFCDLLSNTRQLIHVKRRSKSSALSHLFLQGHVSAEAFLDYPALRTQIREAAPELADLIPAARPDPAHYEIVYVFLHEGNATLPFFSKVALASVHRQLRRMSYRVAIAWVGPNVVA